MIDRLWESGEYISWLETRRTKPTVGVHRALIRWTDGVVRDSHVKIEFESRLPCRYIAHEVVAWLIAMELKLPVPEFAGLLLLSPEQVSAAHPQRLKGGDVLAWVTSTEPEQALLITKGMERDAHLIKELQAWEHAAAACAFDEWLANVDRYPRNLLRRGPNDFTLIDHDYIAGGPNWLPDALTAMTFDTFKNVLREMVAPAAKGADRLFSNSMLKHAEAYPDAIKLREPSVVDWLTRLVDEDEDREALSGFIRARADSTQNLIRRRYRLLV